MALVDFGDILDSEAGGGWTAWTCILHFMSSMGVSIKLQNAPAMAPQVTSAGIGSFWSES